MMGFDHLGTLNVEQVAELIGASAWWVAEQARRRRVPHVRFGRGAVRFREQDVAALLELAVLAPTGGREPAESPALTARAATDSRSPADEIYQLHLIAGRPKRAALMEARKLQPGYTP